jgi:hypothetical protein
VHLVDRVLHRVAQEALDRGNPASRVTNGNENVSVLPLPVLLLPNTSRPTRVSGKGLVLDREGVADAARVSASTSGWPTPKSATVFLKCHASKDVFSMVTLHAATLVASARWRDCRWSMSIARGNHVRCAPVRCDTRRTGVESLTPALSQRTGWVDTAETTGAIHRSSFLKPVRE